MWNRGGRKQLLERLDALEKAVEGHRSGLKAIRLEWEDVYDRVNRTMGRLNARIRKSEAVSSPESNAEETTQPVAPPPGRIGTHAVLREMRAKHGLLPG